MITCVLLLKAADPHQRWITMDGGQHVLIEGVEGGGARVVGGAGGKLNNVVLRNVKPEHMPPLRPPDRARRPPPGQRDKRPPGTPPVDVKPPPVEEKPPSTPPGEKTPDKPSRPLSDLSLDESRTFRAQLIKDKNRKGTTLTEKHAYMQILRQVERWIDRKNPEREDEDTPPTPPEKKPTRIPPSWDTPAGTGERIWEGERGVITNKEKTYHDKAFSHPNLPHAVLAAIQKAPPLSAVHTTSKARSSHYLPSRIGAGNGMITMKPAGRDQERVNAVWRHEFGHHVDYSIGETVQGEGLQRGDEVSMLDAPTLKKEADDLITRLQASRAATANEKPFRQVVETMHTEIDAALAGGAALETALQAQLAKAGFDPEEYRDVFGESWDKRNDVVRVLAGAAIRNVDMCQNTKPVTLGSKYNVQDFFSAITNNRVKYECGHSTAYYKWGRPTVVPGLTDSNCTEAFANWFDAQSAPVRFWCTLLMKLAPETHAAFQQRVDTWLTT